MKQVFQHRPRALPELCAALACIYIPTACKDIQLEPSGEKPPRIHQKDFFWLADNKSAALCTQAYTILVQGIPALDCLCFILQHCWMSKFCYLLLMLSLDTQAHQHEREHGWIRQFSHQL